MIMMNLICSLIFLAATMHGITSMKLSDFRWKRRLLVLAGSSDAANEKALRQITDSYRYKCDMSVRNMNVILLGASESSVTVFNFDKIDGPTVKTSTMSQSDAAGVMSELYMSSDAKPWGVLVGYDGGKKQQYSSDNVQTYLQGMFDTIDRMPMRRREMKEQERDGIGCVMSGMSVNSGANRL